MSATQKKLPKGELDQQLEDALEHTFPASDPVSVGQPTSTKPDRPAHRRAAALDTVLVHDLAARVRNARARNK